VPTLPTVTGGRLVLRLHFDYTVPSAVVALWRCARLADEGAAVAFVGQDVLGLRIAVPVTLDQLDDLTRTTATARTLGLELRRPSRRPPTLSAHLLGELADQQGHGAHWRARCVTAYWQQDADLGDHEVLCGLAGEVGLDRATVEGTLADPAAAATLRRRMLRDRSRGIGGVPVLETAGGALVPADLSDEDLRALAW
jgi:predicted DsbA family dithiol-disulfide isomerase